MKKCFKCQKEKQLNEFYVHARMKDGHLNKCKDCAKKDAKIGTIKRICWTCKKSFLALPAEIKRGGGIVCSRICYYKRLAKVVKRDKESPNWKGDDVGKEALHNWVQRHKGKPQRCEHCHTTKKGLYDWANKSGKYKRQLLDWMRLCRKCHAHYDKETRVAKWRATVKRKHNWKVKN